MTSKQVINNLLYEYNKPDNYNEIILKALQNVKKDLEVLEILKSFITGNADNWYIDISSCDVENPNYSIIKEWLNDDK